MNKKDIDLIRAFKRSPILFAEKMWGLIPQPLKAKYRYEPLEAHEYTVDMFEPFVKGKHLTWQQWLLFRAVERGIEGKAPKKISIESGQGTGKTAALAMLIIWFLFTNIDARVPCTAPTAPQMFDALWRELYIWWDKLRPEFKALFEWTSDTFRVKERPETWFARARTAAKEKPEALAGIHADHIMVVIDEASGIDDEIFRVAQGMLAGEDVFFIMFSQHTRLYGYFHHSFDQPERYQLLSFSSLDSPVVHSDFIKEMRENPAYGEESDAWRVQVLGKSPKADVVDDKGYVPLLVESDIRIAPDLPFTGQRKMGIDPSGEGEDTTEWAIRDPFKAKIVASERISSATSIAAKTLALLDSMKVKAHDTWVDNFGEGANVGLEVARGQKFVKPINVGDDAQDKDRFMNRRAEVFWRLREWLRKGGEIMGPDAQSLKEELLTLKYRYGQSGKIQLMPKLDMKKLGFKSPNKADALSLTFAEIDRPQAEVKNEEEPLTFEEKHSAI